MEPHRPRIPGSQGREDRRRGSGQPPQGRPPAGRARRTPEPQHAPQKHYPLPLDTRRLLTGQADRALAHPGLAFQRFIGYETPWVLEQKGQKKLLDDIARRNRDLAKADHPLNHALSALHRRMVAAIQSLEAAGWHVRTLTARTQWRLVVGLGAASVLEGSGMVLHRLYGFPYLPGSGLKGLVRHYLWHNGHTDDKDPVIGGIFGSQTQRGAVMFWDALPETWPGLEVDITNAHYQEYYMPGSDQGTVPPADYLSPNPVYFLTVAPETPFRFTLLSRRVPLLEQTQEYLRQAIELLGVGAKTRAGYGGMSPV